MRNTLLIASAGAGKTYELVKRAINQKETSLITTFTKENEKEIIKIIYDLNHGAIPHHITVQTWFSFLLENGVKPFQGSLISNNITGLHLVNQKSGIRYRNKGGIPVPFKETDIKHHYFNNKYEIYSDKISKFSLKCDQKSNGNVFDRLEKIYKHIYIDEVQDLAGHDLTFIQKLLNTSIILTMAGDPRQVTYLTHFPSVNKKYSEGKIEEFLRDKGLADKVFFDNETLVDSRRNCQFICEYSNRLFPYYPAAKSIQYEENNHIGMFLVKEKDTKKYLNSFNPLQLRYNRGVRVNSNYTALNFGEAKGKTVDHVLIYPTKEIVKWIKDNSYSLKFKSRCQFYVALTRAKFSVGIVWNELEKVEGLEFYSP